VPRMQVAIYLQVSSPILEEKADLTDDVVGYREHQLRRYADAAGWRITHVYREVQSDDKAGRVQFETMMEAASRHEFDVVFVWCLDSFGEDGIAKTCEHLRRLASYRVAFRSYSEQFLDTTGDSSELITAIFDLFAKFERKRILERVRAGLDRAKAEGKQLGRPRLAIDDVALKRMHEEGQSLRQMAGKLEISPATVRRRLLTFDKETPRAVVISESDKDYIRRIPVARPKPLVRTEPVARSKHLARPDRRKLSLRRIKRAWSLARRGTPRMKIAARLNVSRVTLWRALRTYRTNERCVRRRRTKLSPGQIRYAWERIAARESTATEVAARLKVNRVTVYRALKRYCSRRKPRQLPPECQLCLRRCSIIPITEDGSGSPPGV